MVYHVSSYIIHSTMHEREKSSRSVEAPRAALPQAPSKTLLQSGMDVLRRVGGVQALVAITALTCVSTTGCSKKETISATAENAYSPEKYPTVKSRVEFLKDRYGIVANILDNDELHHQNYTSVKYVENNCGCKTEHFTEVDLPRKVEKGDPKNFLPFLDAICSALAKYPPEIFVKMKGLKINMAGKIEMKHLAGGLAAGYADGPSHIVMIWAGKDGTQLVFHHEFFHALDFRHNDLKADDEQWVKNTHSKGKYAGYEHAMDGSPWAPPVGFAQGYGKASVPEDQARMGEDLFLPHYLKFHLRRAKEDPALHTRIQLLTASIIDVKTGRFSRTMTLEEYKAYSGFDGYRYYHQWAPSMDHTFWNAVLDEVEPADEVTGTADSSRNFDDAGADLMYHLSGNFFEQSGQLLRAGDMYSEAHETKLSKNEYLLAAAEYEKLGSVATKDFEKRINFENAAKAYMAAGETEKANTLYESQAEQDVKNNDFTSAALNFARSDNTRKSHIYGLKAFIGIRAVQQSSLKGNFTYKSVVAMDAIDIAKTCYQWENLPEVGVGVLHAAAKEIGGLTAVEIYEKLDEVEQVARTAYQSERHHHKGKHLPELGSEAVVQQWYVKMAGSLENGNDKRVDLLRVADLYRKGGDVVAEKRCIDRYFTESAQLGYTDLIAKALRKYADLREEKGVIKDISD